MHEEHFCRTTQKKNKSQFFQFSLNKRDRLDYSFVCKNFHKNTHTHTNFYSQANKLACLESFTSFPHAKQAKSTSIKLFNYRRVCLLLSKEAELIKFIYYYQVMRSTFLRILSYAPENILFLSVIHVFIFILLSLF